MSKNHREDYVIQVHLITQEDWLKAKTNYDEATKDNDEDDEPFRIHDYVNYICASIIEDGKNRILDVIPYANSNASGGIPTEIGLFLIKYSIPISELKNI